MKKRIKSAEKKTFMFYSTEILSVKTKSSLAIIYHISSTNNRYKKIPRTDIIAININSAINTLKQPPEPFSLRLYAYLLKGIVKLYIMKLRMYETDVTGMLKVKHKRNPNLTKRPTINLNPIDEFITSLNRDISINDDFIDTDQNPHFEESLSNNFFIETNFTPEIKRCKRKIIDLKLSMNEKELYIENKIINYQSISKTQNYINNEIFIIKELNKAISQKVEEIEIQRHISSSSFNPSSFDMIDSFSSRMDLNDMFINEDDVIGDEDDSFNIIKRELLMESTNFNMLISSSNRYLQSKSFLYLLEIANEVEIIQKSPFDTIIVNNIK
ncbi:Meiotic recombination protein rec8 [Astathelohania contejeani]|uniref:Meiotic recombination protein rec8 n=1 Tax=Astathelohania contejeani TaxID=164912 RepID=A0ABQ7I077_9MICR|nr:Meiotic recombination protein rec8 [Thelohania contejeani]